MGDVFAYDYDQYDLGNGLRLITVPAPFPAVVSVYIVVQAVRGMKWSRGAAGLPTSLST